MNKKSRAERDRAVNLLHESKTLCEGEDWDAAQGKFEQAKEIIVALAEEEREKFDSMGEGLQQSSNGQAIGEAADQLESAQSNAEDIDFETDDDDERDEIAEKIDTVIDALEAV